MATKFSELDPADPLVGTEIVAVSQLDTGVLRSKKTTVADIAALAGTGGGGTGGASSADQVSFDGSVSGLSSTNVQQAIDEVASRITPAVITTADASFTPTASDSNTVFRFTSPSAVSVTLPDDSSVNFPVGSVIQFRQAGDGKVTISPGAGVTLNSAETMSSRKKGSTIAAMKVASNEWDVTGDLEVSP